MGLGSMAMTALGGLLAMLAGLLRDLTQLAVSPSGLSALAAGVLAGAVLAAFLRQRDPDAAGRTRPRAPSAAPAAATSR